MSNGNQATGDIDERSPHWLWFHIVASGGNIETAGGSAPSLLILGCRIEAPRVLGKPPSDRALSGSVDQQTLHELRVGAECARAKHSSFLMPALYVGFDLRSWVLRKPTQNPSRLASSCPLARRFESILLLLGYGAFLGFQLVTHK